MMDNGILSRIREIVAGLSGDEIEVVERGCGRFCLAVAGSDGNDRITEDMQAGDLLDYVRQMRQSVIDIND